VLNEQGRMDKYAKCVRLLLIPHFYVSYRQMTVANTKTRPSNRNNITNALRRCAFQAVEGTTFEKMIKRLGGIAFTEGRTTDDINGTQLHDYALKLAEYLYKCENYTDMFNIVCYAFIDQKIGDTGLTTFRNLLYFSCIKARSFGLAFEFVRGLYNHMINKVPNEGEAVLSSNEQLIFRRLFNAINYILCNQQNVAYHRFVMRALAKSPTNFPLHMISGNNSLVTGSYRHALGEYFSVWLQNREDPLACLLIALTFVQMATKKDITGRQCLAVKAIAFINRYKDLRGSDNPEAIYNIGRMFHQMGITHMAIQFYKRVLDLEEIKLRQVCPETGRMTQQRTTQYSMKPMAAHNLALLYESSGNRTLARELMEQYCVF